MALPTNSRIENLRGVIAGRQHTNGFAVDMEILTDSSEAIGITINNIIKDVRSYELQRFLHQSFQESNELRQLIEKLTGSHNNSNANSNHSNSKYQNEKENKQTVKRQRDYNEELPEAKRKTITSSENLNSASSSETCRRVLPFVSKSSLETNNKQWANNVDKTDVKKENFENNSKKVSNGHDIVNNKNTANGFSTYSNGGQVENSYNHSEPENSTRSSQYNTTPGKKRQIESDQKYSDRKDTKNTKADDFEKDKNIKKRESYSSSSSSSSSSSKDQGRDTKSRKDNYRSTSNNNNNNNNNNYNNNNNNNNYSNNNNNYNNNNFNNNNNNNNNFQNNNSNNNFNNNNSGEETSKPYAQSSKSASDLAMKLDAEGRELKHIADNKQKKPGMMPLDKVGRATKYLEAGLKFVQSLDVREDIEKERFNVLPYNRIAQYFKESAHMFIDWQKGDDCPPLNLYVTLCYVCESVLLHKRNCKIVPSIKKKREERLKEIKELRSILSNNTTPDPTTLTTLGKFLQDSHRFMEELNDILQSDPWEKALISSKALNNFNLPPSQITLKELVSFVKRELDIL